MAEHDLTALMAAQLDRHLVFPLLEFLQERQLYSEPEFLEAKIRLLSGTNMVDYAMDIHKSLHGTDNVPEDMVKRRAEVVSRLRSLEEAAAPLVAFLQNPQLVQELRPDKQYNIHMLQERYQVRFSTPSASASFSFSCIGVIPCFGASSDVVVKLGVCVSLNSLKLVCSYSEAIFRAT